MVFTQKTNPKTGKSIGKPVLSGYQFTFNTAMNSAIHQQLDNFQVQIYVQVRVKVGKKFQSSSAPANRIHGELPRQAMRCSADRASRRSSTAARSP